MAWREGGGGLVWQMSLALACDFLGAQWRWQVLSVPSGGGEGGGSHQFAPWSPDSLARLTEKQPPSDLSRRRSDPWERPWLRPGACHSEEIPWGGGAEVGSPRLLQGHVLSPRVSLVPEQGQPTPSRHQAHSPLPPLSCLPHTVLWLTQCPLGLPCPHSDQCSFCHSGSFRHSGGNRMPLPEYSGFSQGVWVGDRVSSAVVADEGGMEAVTRSFTSGHTPTCADGHVDTQPGPIVHTQAERAPFRVPPRCHQRGNQATCFPSVGAVGMWLKSPRRPRPEQLESHWRNLLDGRAGAVVRAEGRHLFSGASRGAGRRREGSAPRTSDVPSKPQRR